MIRTILLVEDDKSSSFLLKSVLQKHGYNILLAGNGLEALGIVSKYPVDLVLTDVVMPYMDGVDLYTELKKRKDTQNIPVIIITDNIVFKDAFFTLGVEHFISKTGQMETLLDKIKTIDGRVQKRQYLKVLVSGSSAPILDKMQKLLSEQSYIVSIADNSADIMQKAFLMSPNIIVLDLRLSDVAQTRELIRALRCFQVFMSTKILTYAYLLPEEMDRAPDYLKFIESEASTCRDSGDAPFIGNFSPLTFIEEIAKHS